METPDKVYLGIQDLGSGYAYDISLDDNGGQEYIRKDALMEWAKGEIMPGNSAEGKGWNWALQTLIDKINSL